MSVGRGGASTPELVPIPERHRFDLDALAARLRARGVPGFDGPVTARQFLGGQSNPTFLLETPEGRTVLRKKPPGRLLPRAHEIEREARILRALEGSGVPVPRVLLAEEDASVIGTPFFLMAHVEGRVFFDRVPVGAPPADTAAIFDDQARVLAALHAVDWRAAGLEGFGRPEGYMARQVALWTRQWEASRAEEMPAMDRLAAWLPGHLPPGEEAAIAHGDFRLGNLVLHPTEPRIVAVLDWELSTIGHPLADLAYACLTWHLDPGADGEQGVLGRDVAAIGMPTEAAFVARYAEAAGRAVPDALGLFIVFSLFRVAAIVAGIWRRALDGNAADPRAAGYREVYRAMAERGWALARGIDPAA